MLLLGLNMNSQVINVSTGVDNSGNALSIGTTDPNWQILSNPSPKACGAHSYWQPSPISGTNANWINDSGVFYSSNPSIYTFERPFVVAAGTTSLTCNFGLAYDDSLTSLELVRPDLTTIPITVVPGMPYYFLSSPVVTSISTPMSGTWKIRAVVDFFDTTAGFLVSGNITLANSTVTNCGNTFVKEINPVDANKPNIFKIPNGDFYTTSSYFPKIIINRFNANGGIIWSRTFDFGLVDSSLMLTDLIVDSSDNQIVGLLNSNSGSFIFKYDEVANAFTWVKNTGNYRTFNVHESSSTKYIVTGANPFSSIEIFEIDQSTGAIGGYQKSGISGEFYSTYNAGSVYGACRYYVDSNSQFFPALYQYDATTGTNNWVKTYIRNSPIARIYPVAPIVDGASLVQLNTGNDDNFNLTTSGTSKIWLVKTNLSGTLTWTKKITVTGQSGFDGVKIINATDGYYLLLNKYTSGQKNLFFVIKTDKNGNVIWTNRYGLPTTENYVTGGFEKGGFLYLTAMSTTYTATSRMILLKLNALGKTETSCGFVNSETAISEVYANVETIRPVVNNSTSFSTSSIVASNAALPYTEIPHCATACTTLLSSVQPSQCGTILPGWYTTIGATWVTGATEYRFKITELDKTTSLPIGAPVYVDRPVNNICLCNIAGTKYDSRYQIEIDVKIGGVWQNTYGLACSVDTPNPVSTIGSQCGTTLTAFNQWITTTNVPVVLIYRFRVTQLDSSLLPVGVPQVLSQSINKFNMTQLVGILYATTYKVEVSLRNTDGTYLPYNVACNVTTPAYPTTQLQSSFCSSFAVANVNQFISAIPVSPAPALYRFRLFDGLSYDSTFDTSNYKFKLVNFTGLMPSTVYNVQVAVKMVGEPNFGPYASTCTIVTPGVLRLTPRITTTSNENIIFKAIAYPNPFASSFLINIESSNENPITVKVYNMIGSLIEEYSVNKDAVSKLEIGANYASGVYNIVVNQDNENASLRVIKQ